MIMEGDVVVMFRDSRIHIANMEDALEIQLPKQDSILNGFKLDGVNALEVVEWLIVPYLVDFANPSLAPIIGKMNFCSGKCLDRRKQGIPTLP